ncbi:hypothetical protein DI396_06525 [Litorivita pollutaquae]|uniref:YjiS-like domain-containing protein n=1 Tax=Litorivita pollutaquae TaxID=2200892 RepID=A0A2V4MPG0_9RHOB|nr:DUF1127 domain-containing protein [Litorivita pollutaquae]OUS22139.1 hypothetical protein A9Q95_03660 [Rhodobacterales bacterium 59_46_T64]PYC48611.1 hypothetical protein DI396_06525 [Litorivita pollutaquae]
MAFAAQTHTAHHGLGDIFHATVANLRGRIERRRTFNRTLNELSSLNARELADLGLNPGTIRAVAHESAYGAHL